MQRELKFLSMAISEPRQPYLAIIGGAKISGKIDVIRNLLKLADHVLIGGAMTYTFLKAQGPNIGSSLVEEEKLDLARELLQEAGDRLVLPVDHVIAKEFSATSESPHSKGRSSRWLDGTGCGSETIRLYESMIHEARMVFGMAQWAYSNWNPLLKERLQLLKQWKKHRPDAPVLLVVVIRKRPSKWQEWATRSHIFQQGRSLTGVPGRQDAAGVAALQ